MKRLPADLFTQGLYDESKCFEYRGHYYEYLIDQPDGEMFRVIYNSDDYDYLVTSELKRELMSYVVLKGITGELNIFPSSLDEGVHYKMLEMVREHLHDLEAAPAKFESRPMDFDVAWDYSLDTLRKEIEALLENPKSKLLFNIRGPGGGNTRVLVEPADQSDRGRVFQYMKDNKLGTWPE